MPDKDKPKLSPYEKELARLELEREVREDRLQARQDPATKHWNIHIHGYSKTGLTPHRFNTNLPGMFRGFTNR